MDISKPPSCIESTCKEIRGLFELADWIHDNGEPYQYKFRAAWIDAAESLRDAAVSLSHKLLKEIQANG